MTRAFILIFIVALAPVLAAQDEKQAGDTTSIDWVYPGDFKSALARAKDENRLLLIKCVFFGVDDEGAKCATKGLW